MRGSVGGRSRQPATPAARTRVVRIRRLERMSASGRGRDAACFKATYNRPVKLPGILADNPRAVEWILRVGAFMCFVGHGAFGIITKESWVKYFAVVGIGRDTAYAMMPLVGALDVS